VSSCIGVFGLKSIVRFTKSLPRAAGIGNEKPRPPAPTRKPLMPDLQPAGTQAPSTPRAPRGHRRGPARLLAAVDRLASAAAAVHGAHIGLPCETSCRDFDRLYVERLCQLVPRVRSARDHSAQDQVHDEQGRVIEGQGSFTCPTATSCDARAHAEFLPCVSIHPARPMR